MAVTQPAREPRTPLHTLVLVFLMTALGVGIGDYLITSNKSVPLSALLGIGCGLIVVRTSRRTRQRR